MRVCLFEDHAETLEPLSLTRPVFDLRCGLSTLAEKAFRFFRATERGAFLRPGIADVYWGDHPGLVCNDPRWLGESVAILVNGRWLPPERPPSLGDQECVGLVDGEIAFVKLSAEQSRFVSPPDLPEWLEHWRNTLPACDAGGSLIRYPWDLVEANAEQICLDFKNAKAREASAVLSHVGLVGPREQLWAHPSARLDPGVVADTTNGPVVIERDAVIHAFTRLEGPCCVGAGTHVVGAKIRAGTTLGPHCRVGGEVEASILQGYVNKYHDGFLGHSYVGAWVNIAAGTHTSDLRCDYGEVKMPAPALSPTIIERGFIARPRGKGNQIQTGLRKVGSFIGDHTRTGLAVLLNTGSIIGVSCQVLPSAGFAPRVIPSFTHWANGSLVEPANLDECCTVARTVMQRRGQAFTPAHRDLFESIWEETLEGREQALRSWEMKGHGATLKRGARMMA